LFEYNNEFFNTGIQEIDSLMSQYSLSEEVSAGIMTQSGLFILDEEGYDILQQSADININNVLANNDEFEQEAASFIDFTERDPFSEGASY